MNRYIRHDYYYKQTDFHQQLINMTDTKKTYLGRTVGNKFKDIDSTNSACFTLVSLAVTLFSKNRLED